MLKWARIELFTDNDSVDVGVVYRILADYVMRMTVLTVYPKIRIYVNEIGHYNA